MTAQHKPPEPSFYPLPDLARHWNCTVEQVLACEALDGLNVTELLLDGNPVRGVMRGDVEAFEGRQQHHGAEEHPAKTQSALFLLGMGLTIWTGEDAEILSHPYELRDFLANDARNALGIEPTGTDKQRTIFRTRETDANLLREALEIFRQSCIYKPHRARVIEAAARAARESQAPQESQIAAQ